MEAVIKARGAQQRHARLRIFTKQTFQSCKAFATAPFGRPTTG
jgi:hypothetical protein